MKHNDFLSSPTNPNGAFDLFTHDRHDLLDVPQSDRLKIATADIYTFMVEVADVDPDMAEIIAARAFTEISVAFNPEIAPEDLQDQIIESIDYARDEMIMRAIGDILG